MGWSTRELADLAGTTVRTVRHYHDVGLIAEPERGSNGYKSYSVAHLVRVLRIKRLTALGFSLAQIQQVDCTDEPPEEVMRALDTELAETIDRLQQIRAELAQILCRKMSADLPPELAFVGATAELSANERSLAFVLSRLIGPAGLRAWIHFVENRERSPLDREFDDLPADADERTRHDLGERMVVATQQVYAEHPDLRTWIRDAPRGPQFVSRTLSQVIPELYNRAQIDVLEHIGRDISPPATSET